MGASKYEKQGMSKADCARLNEMVADEHEFADIVISRPTGEGWINGPWSRKIYVDESYPANRSKLKEIGEVWTIGGDKPSDHNTHHQVRMFVDMNGNPDPHMMTILNPRKRRFVSCDSRANVWFNCSHATYRTGGCDDVVEVKGWDTISECTAAVVDYLYSSMATIEKRRTGRFSGWQ